MKASVLPDYLSRHYSWAYLNPRSVRFFDRPLIVSAILWGYYRALTQAALAEIAPGDRVLQKACVYGCLSGRIADKTGPDGRLDVIDIAPIQVETNAAKLRHLDHVRVRLADAADRQEETYDVILSFFLLHEVPEDYKRRIVNTALEDLAEGGKAVFIDYHCPRLWNPLRYVMAGIFALLEPFADRLWTHEIKDYAEKTDLFVWRKTLYCGGLYQRVVAEKKTADTVFIKR